MNNSKERILEKLKALTDFVNSVEVNFYITEAQHDQLLKQLEKISEDNIKFRNRAFNTQQDLEKAKARIEYLELILKGKGWEEDD